MAASGGIALLRSAVRTRGQLGAPGRLADRFNAGQQPELAEHEQVVAGRSMSGDLAARDVVDVDLVGFEGPAGRRHGVQDASGSDPRRELPQVSAPRHDPVHDRVTASEFLLDLDVQVGERRAPRRDAVPQRGVAARPPDAEVGEVVIDQLVNDRQLSVVPTRSQKRRTIAALSCSEAMEFSSRRSRRGSCRERWVPWQTSDIQMSE
jgi:hypothetical protein